MLLSASWHIASPDGHLDVSLHPSADAQRMSLQVRADADSLLCTATVGLTLSDGTEVLQPHGCRVTRRHQLESIDTRGYRQTSMGVEYNELTLSCRTGFALQVRAYNQGIAYRYVSDCAVPYGVRDEWADYSFGPDRQVWLSHTTSTEHPYAMAFQNQYAATTFAQADTSVAFLPAVVTVGSYRVTLLESDVESYPGMFVRADSMGHLTAEFARCPTVMQYYPWRHMSHVAQRADCVARCEGTRTLPWRILGVTADDRDMPVSPLVYALAAPCRIEDTDWIRPGKAAWEWWNDWNLSGVPFVSGINMPTYRYYIDFAAAHGLEYVVLDEGWYDPASGNMLTAVPDIDLPALIDYAGQRGVRLLLWTVFNVLDEQLDAACRQYADMGIAGFKVDFLDRNDQMAVQMAYRIAARCAEHGLVLDYHGFYTPTGMQRTYPNVLNYESLFGMEEMKWSPATVDMPRYDVTMPYIRMQSGPVDYTPGAMRNATRRDWAASYGRPVSQGTRCHQMAAYVVYDSPLTMLCDAPTCYEREADYTRALCSLPNVYAQTRVLQGRMGEYIVTARRDTLGNWYVGAMTDWNERDLTLQLDFLPQDSLYEATLYCDGVNAHRQAEDYAVSVQQVDARQSVRVHLAPGGGMVMILKTGI